MKTGVLVAALAAFLVAAGVTTRAKQGPPPTSGDRLTADVLKGLEFRSIGPDDPDRPRAGHRHRSEISQHLVRRRGVRRVVEDDQSRLNLHARSSITAARSTCAASSSIRRIRTCCGSAPVRTRASAARISATASTSPPTPGRPGSASGSRSRSTSGNILIDPRNSNVVYVAAQGPLFSAGGERGLYKTTDGGATWNARAQRQR